MHLFCFTSIRQSVFFGFTASLALSTPSVSYLYNCQTVFRAAPLACIVTFPNALKMHFLMNSFLLWLFVCLFCFLISQQCAACLY